MGIVSSLVSSRTLEAGEVAVASQKNP